MSRATDPAADAAHRADGPDEGAGYAVALLERIGAGTSSPEDLAAVMQFLHAGPQLHSACAVLFMALRLALARGANG